MRGQLVGLFGDVQQVAPQRLQLLGADAPRYQTVGFFDQRLDGLLQGTACVRQADDDAAAIRFAVFPDDQRFFLQTAHNAGNGGGVQTQVLGQLGGSLLVLRFELGNGFLRCSKSFLINRDFIESSNSDKVTLKDGKEFTITRNYTSNKKIQII